MNDLYCDGSYLHNNPGWHEEDSAWKVKQIQTLLKRNHLEFSTVCEIGCGAGAILAELARANPAVRFSGYDISKQAFEKCEPRAAANLEFFQQDLLQTGDQQFDLALAMDVFEHVEDYFGFLRSFKKIAPYKIFHIPLDLSLQSLLRRKPILRSRSQVGHLHYFFKETALATLADCGYDVLDFFYTGASIDAKNRKWKSRLLRIPRRALFALNQDFAVRLLGGYSLIVLAK